MVLVDLEFLLLFVVTDMHPPEILLAYYVRVDHLSDYWVGDPFQFLELFVLLGLQIDDCDFVEVGVSVKAGEIADLRECDGCVPHILLDLLPQLVVNIDR